MKKRIMTAGMLAMILAIGMTACTKADNTTKTEKTSESDGKKELKKSDDEKNVMNAEQKKIYEKIKLTYKEEEQKKVAETHYTQSWNQSKKPRKKCIEQDEDNLRECREKYGSKEYTD